MCLGTVPDFFGIDSLRNQEWKAVSIKITPGIGGSDLSMSENVKNTKKQVVLNGPDVIRTHDLPVISRAHHRAMLRAQKIALITLITTASELL